MKNIFAAIGCIAVATVLSACGAGAPTVSPLTTSSPPPMTPNVPPTLIQTATPSSGTPFPIASTPLPSTLTTFAAALNKTKSATQYRVAMLLSVQPSGTSPFSLDLKGEVNGEDEHYVYQLGGEQTEYVAARGQFYAKGAQSIGLPTATKWYMLTPDLADAARPPFGPEDVLLSFAAQTAKENFQPFTRESLDAQACQVWHYLPKTLAETGIGNALGSEQEANAFNVLDQAEIKAWVCEDGALHQLSVEIAAHNPRRTTEKGNAKLLLHVWDIQSASIKIDPPANAEPFQLGAPIP